jgi:hypothetical protein
MSASIRWSTLSILFLAAFFCYSVGFGVSSAVLIIAGVVFECCFWLKLIRSPHGKALL